jgi:hypothetical protein
MEPLKTMKQVETYPDLFPLLVQKERYTQKARLLYGAFVASLSIGWVFLLFSTILKPLHTFQTTLFLIMSALIMVSYGLYMRVKAKNGAVEDSLIEWFQDMRLNQIAEFSLEELLQWLVTLVKTCPVLFEELVVVNTSGNRVQKVASYAILQERTVFVPLLLQHLNQPNFTLRALSSQARANLYYLALEGCFYELWFPVTLQVLALLEQEGDNPEGDPAPLEGFLEQFQLKLVSNLPFGAKDWVGPRRAEWIRAYPQSDLAGRVRLCRQAMEAYVEWFWHREKRKIGLVVPAAAPEEINTLLQPCQRSYLETSLLLREPPGERSVNECKTGEQDL